MTRRSPFDRLRASGWFTVRGELVEPRTVAFVALLAIATACGVKAPPRPPEKPAAAAESEKPK